MRFQLKLFAIAIGLANPHAPLDELGIRIGRMPRGPLNAITDVAGVRVGHVTLNEGEATRTGVTLVVPPGDPWASKLPAGKFVLNGAGEATGLMWIEESGVLESAIALTNTLSVSEVHRGMLDLMLAQHPEIGRTDDAATPVVLECDDGALNDIQSHSVRPEHVSQAYAVATDGSFEQGGVGAGTGMISYDYKGGIGSASRLVRIVDREFRVGVLVNANHGDRATLRVGGFPVGPALTDPLPLVTHDGSIVIVVATDAPLDSRQLTRLSRRAMLGLARTGAVAHHGSGDLAIAFSTAYRIAHRPPQPVETRAILSDAYADAVFEATADATEEAVIHSMLFARTTIGRDGNTAYGLTLEALRTALRAITPRW